jgi:uncharacterized membrane protein YvbJ
MERDGKEEDMVEVYFPLLECLECGKKNISDNMICGYCGVNLPLVYDRRGRAVRHLGGTINMKVSPYVRKFTQLMIILMVAMACTMIFRWLKEG